MKMIWIHNKMLGYFVTIMIMIQDFLETAGKVDNRTQIGLVCQAVNNILNLLVQVQVSRYLRVRSVHQVLEIRIY